MENALTIQALSKHYDDFTLGPLDLTLPSGCIMGFIGENGAGKTTTIKLIMDLVQRDAGRVTLLGQDARTCEIRLREHIGVVMDECCLPELLNHQQINRIMRRIYRTWDEAAFKRWGEMFKLNPKKPVKDYSRGMKMKLGLAVALSHDSRLLLLDEATSGLDPVARDELLDVFLDFIQDEGHSIFISSHIISDLEKICDYITLIQEGKIVFSQPKDELLEHYGLFAGSEAELAALPAGAVQGVRRHHFGVEALLRRELTPDAITLDPAGIEDIMLFYRKEQVL